MPARIGGRRLLTSVLRQVAIAGPVTIAPTLGSELLTDGGLETWASATDLTSWVEIKGGTSSINQEAATIHGGANAARLDVDGSGSNAAISQALTHSAGDWIRLSGWVRASASGKTALFTLDQTVVSAGLDPGTTYTQYPVTLRSTAANQSAVFKRGAATSVSLYFDDLSAKTITFATTLSTIADAFVPRVIRAAITRTANTQAGVCHYADENNLVLAYLDGVGNVKLDKLLAGTWSNLGSATVAYSAGAVLELDFDPALQRYSVQYGGNTVISYVSVTDAVFQGAKGSRLFSTYELNSFSSIYASEGSVAVLSSYASLVRATESANLLAYWPLFETSGTVVEDISGNARHGTSTGLTLGSVAGPGPTMGMAALWDGANDYANVYSASLAAALNKDELTLALWAKVRAASVWVDGTARGAFRAAAGTATNGQLYFQRHTVNNQIICVRDDTGAAKTITIDGLSTTGWFHLAATVSVAANVFAAYCNGALVSSDTAATWTDAISAGRLVVGALTTGPANVWDGYLMHAALWSKALAATQIAALAVAA